jgi:hypothetical protein
MIHLKKYENFEEWVTFEEYGCAFNVDKNGYLIFTPLLQDGTKSTEISTVCSNADLIDEEFLRKMKSVFVNFKLDDCL